MESTTTIHPRTRTGRAPSLSTIKEFQVISNNYTAEFGRGFGAVVLVQTKSGTNEIHGDVYEFHQDSALKAKSFFTPGTAKKPVDRRNQYGFTGGLPIIKDRFFFYGSFDQDPRLRRSDIHARHITAERTDAPAGASE